MQGLVPGPGDTIKNNIEMLSSLVKLIWLKKLGYETLTFTW